MLTLFRAAESRRELYADESKSHWQASGLYLSCLLQHARCTERTGQVEDALPALQEGVSLVSVPRSPTTSWNMQHGTGYVVRCHASHQRHLRHGRLLSSNLLARPTSELRLSRNLSRTEHLLTDSLLHQTPIDPLQSATVCWSLSNLSGHDAG